MSLYPTSSSRPDVRFLGKLASFLITAVALAIALASSPGAIAGEAALHPDAMPSARQDDVQLQDSDGDGLADRLEIQQYRTNPLHPDSDRDGVTDSDEATLYRSSPLNVDADGDGLLDGDEVRFGTDLLLVDTDGDGLGDGTEIATSADPFNADSDGDGIADGVEVIKLSSSPVTADSDGDGLTDGDEVAVYNTNPSKDNEIQVYTWTPGETGGRVPVTSAAAGNKQPLHVANAPSQPTIARVPLAPLRFTPVLQALDWDIDPQARVWTHDQTALPANSATSFLPFPWT